MNYGIINLSILLGVGFTLIIRVWRVMIRLNQVIVKIRRSNRASAVDSGFREQAIVAVADAVGGTVDSDSKAWYSAAIGCQAFHNKSKLPPRSSNSGFQSSFGGWRRSASLWMVPEQQHEVGIKFSRGAPLTHLRCRRVQLVRTYWVADTGRAGCPPFRGGDERGRTCPARKQCRRARMPPTQLEEKTMLRSIRRT